jgi:predicted DNA-binding protein
MLSKDAKTAKAPKPNIGARLPHEVYEKFLQVKEMSGKSESQLINEAIAAYVGMKTETVPDRVSKLENTLADLQQQVQTILGKFQRLATR